jgi:hypothetical protein
MIVPSSRVVMLPMNINLVPIVSTHAKNLVQQLKKKPKESNF